MIKFGASAVSLCTKFGRRVIRLTKLSDLSRPFHSIQTETIILGSNRLREQVKSKKDNILQVSEVVLSQ